MAVHPPVDHSYEKDVEDLHDLVRFHKKACVLLVQQQALGYQFDFTEDLRQLEEEWQDIDIRLDKKERAKMTALALTFPPLTRKTPGISPFDAEILDDWAATTPRLRRHTIAAVRFILSVWSSTREWRTGRFSLIDFYRNAGQRHWLALAAFCEKPFMLNH